MKVLIIKVSALGDVVHALPVLQHIHTAHPGAQIDWLVEEAFVDLLNGHPLLRQVLPLRTKRWRKLPLLEMLTEVRQFTRLLRSETYDIVLDLQGNSKSGLFTFLSKGRKKYGFDRKNVRELPNLLATRYHVSVAEEEHHIAQRSLAIAKAAFPGDITVPSAGPLSVDENSRAKVKAQLESYGLAGEKIVVCHYGTTWTTKLWALSSWQKLAKQFVEEMGLRPILTWGNAEEKLAAEKIVNFVDGQAFLWPRGSLQEFVALMEAADLVVGCDTGPIHIAAAVGTPTVSLFRVTDATRNGPEGDTHIRLQTTLECASCLRKTCDQDQQCSVSIPVADVRAAVTSLL